MLKMQKQKAKTASEIEGLSTEPSLGKWPNNSGSRKCLKINPRNSTNKEQKPDSEEEQTMQEAWSSLSSIKNTSCLGEKWVKFLKKIEQQKAMEYPGRQTVSIVVMRVWVDGPR